MSVGDSVVDGSAFDPTAVVAGLAKVGLTLAVAESLTGGALTARIVDVPGASAVLRGGVCAYAVPLKAQLLGVDAALLDAQGPVHPQVAAEMAQGIARLMGADLALSTTGVAGPGPADGHPAGTVFIACYSPLGTRVRECHFTGERPQVRALSVNAALRLLGDVLDMLAAPCAD